jgi:hypothetical protein
MTAVPPPYDQDPIVKLFQTTLAFVSSFSPEGRRLGLESIKVRSLSDQIALLLDSSKIETPFAKGDQISFELNFLKFLWICVYCILVTTECVIERETAGTWQGDLSVLFERGDFLDAFYLFQKALRARPAAVQLSEWLPTPDTDGKIVQAANACFHIAVAFIFYHEMAHVILGHQKLEVSDRIESEKQADTFAMELLIGHVTEDRQKRSVAIGMANAFYTSLFLLNDIRQLKQGPTHPDIDQRLLNLLNGVNLADETIGYYLKRMTTIALDLFLKLVGGDIHQHEFKTVDQALEAYWRAFDSQKEEAF